MQSSSFSHRQLSFLGICNIYRDILHVAIVEGDRRNMRYQDYELHLADNVPVWNLPWIEENRLYFTSLHQICSPSVHTWHKKSKPQPRASTPMSRTQIDRCLDVTAETIRSYLKKPK